jgi:hypothetical protein
MTAAIGAIVAIDHRDATDPQAIVGRAATQAIDHRAAMAQRHVLIAPPVIARPVHDQVVIVPAEARDRIVARVPNGALAPTSPHLQSYRSGRSPSD